MSILHCTANCLNKTILITAFMSLLKSKDYNSNGKCVDVHMTDMNNTDRICKAYANLCNSLLLTVSAFSIVRNLKRSSKYSP